MLTQQPDVPDTQRSSLTLSYSRLLPHRHRIFTQGTLEQNRELGFDLRSRPGGRMGVHARAQHPQPARRRRRPCGQPEKPIEGESTTNLEAVLGVDYENFAYDFPNTDIEVTAYGFVGLNQWGRFRRESSASLKRELFKDFYSASGPTRATTAIPPRKAPRRTTGGSA